MIGAQIAVLYSHCLGVALLNQGHNFVSNYKDYIESVRNGFTQSHELSVLLAHQLFMFFIQLLYQFIIKLDYDLAFNSTEIKNIWTLITDAKCRPFSRLIF